MAASFTIAARNNGFSKAEGREATLRRRARTAGHGRVRRDVDHGDLVRPPLRRGADGWPSRPLERTQKEKAQKKAAKRAAATGGEGAAEGPQPRQPAGARQARRARRRQVPDRQPAAHRGPGAGLRELLRHPHRRAAARHPRPVPGLSGHAAGGPSPPARALRDRRHGAQGRGRRQRRDPRLHRAAPGTRRARSLVSAGQGGDGLGARGPSAEEPSPARIARRRTGSG